MNRRIGRCAAVFSLLLLACASAPPERYAAWRPLGPDAGDPIDVSFEGGALLVVTPGGRFASDDGGRTWRRIDPAAETAGELLPEEPAPADALLDRLVRGHEPRIVTSGGGGRVATWCLDAGAFASIGFHTFWMAGFAPLDGTDRAVRDASVARPEPNPVRPRVEVVAPCGPGGAWIAAVAGAERVFCYAGAEERRSAGGVYGAVRRLGRVGGTVFAATSGGLFVSDDDGRSFRRLGGEWERRVPVDLRPVGDRLLVVFADGAVGETDPGFAPPAARETPIRGPVAAAANGRTVAVAAANGLWVSEDGGRTFADRGAGLAGLDARALVAPGDGALLLLAGNRVWRRGRGGDWTVPWTGETCGGGGLAAGAKPGTTFLRTPGGLFATTDSGRSFAVVLAGEEDDWPPVPGWGFSLLVPADPALGLFAAGGETLARSRDGGRRWARVEVPASYPSVSVAGNRLWAVSGVVIDSPDVWYSDDGGATWSRTEASAREGFADFFFDPGDHDRVFSVRTDDPFVEEEQRLEMTPDAGRTWVRAGAPLPPGDGLRLVPAPGRPTWLLRPDGPRLSLSRDGGDSWEEIGAGLPEGVLQDAIRDPERPDRLLLLLRPGGVHARDFDS